MTRYIRIDLAYEHPDNSGLHELPPTVKPIIDALHRNVGVSVLLVRNAPKAEMLDEPNYRRAKEA